MNWELGACRGVGPELFFPKRGDNTAVFEARAVCAGCPIRVECLEYAVGAKEPFGVWGGLTVDQREKLHAPAQPLRVPRLLEGAA
jgi:WhiB family redox-sensing transcriptional regulator